MLPNELEDIVEEWKEIFDSNSPEERITPVELGRKYNEFQKLCILRALRPDKIVFGVEGFVRSFLGV
jgi:dynein heavy chain